MSDEEGIIAPAEAMVEDVGGANLEGDEDDDGVQEAPVELPLPAYLRIYDGVDRLTPLSDELLFGSISAFLTFQELKSFVAVSKYFASALSYDAVLSSFRNPDQVKSLIPMALCLPFSSIYVPSPIRLLRILSRRNCERCRQGAPSDEQKLMGLFLCGNCQNVLSCPIQQVIFHNKNWGCPDDDEAKSQSLMQLPFTSFEMGQPVLAGPVVTVQGLNLVATQRPELIQTAVENPELLFCRISWLNMVQLIQSEVGTPPTNYECDVFFRLIHRHACGCRRCLSTELDDCPAVNANWEAFFSEG